MLNTIEMMGEIWRRDPGQKRTYNNHVEHHVDDSVLSDEGGERNRDRH